MAHLTLQLGAALVVPFGTMRRGATDTTPWKARSLREAAAIDAGLPILAGRFNRCAQVRLLARVPARWSGSLDWNEA